MASAEAAAWAALGTLLIQRRAQLDPSFMNRRLFASERGLDYRLVADVERARRQNFEESTRAAIEVAYKLRPGAIARYLAGGELEPLPAEAATGPSVPPDPPPGPHRFPHLYEPELERWIISVRDELAEAMRAYGPEFSGAQAFPDDDLAAEAWDYPNLTPDETVRHIARLRMLADRVRRRKSGEQSAL